MDMHGITAHTTTLAENAAKSGFHAVWTYTAAHPHFATAVGLALILASGIIGFAIGVGA